MPETAQVLAARFAGSDLRQFVIRCQRLQAIARVTLKGAGRKMVAGLQKAPVPDAELAGVEQTARRLNDVTRDIADTAPALCDPFVFGAALRRQSGG